MPTLRVPQDFTSIAQAVAAASAGDTIIVDPAYSGTESVTVSVANLTISAAATTPALRVTLGSGVTGFTATGGNATEIFGNALANIMTGGDSDNFFRGGAGDDTINGGAGNDTADYKNAAGSVSVTLTDMSGGHTGGSSSGSDGADTLIDIENVRGGAFNDTLTGNSEDNVLRGNAGSDVIDGGAGSDMADYRGAAGSVTVTLTDGSGGHTGGASSGADGVDTLIDIERIRGSTFADTLTGNSGDNWLRGGEGDDRLDGGGGYDWADYKQATAAVSVTLTNGSGGHTGGSSSGADGADTLVDIEAIRGGAFNDTLTGNSYDNTLRGDEGADTLNGGAGEDWASYVGASGGVSVTLTNLVSGHTGGSSSGADGADTLIDIEDLSGSAFADTLNGNAYANALRGNEGADTLNGGGGEDWASYLHASGGVTVTLTNLVSGHTGGSSSGADGSDTLIDIEDISGSGFGDTLVGNAYANVLRGNEGADTLNGGGGEDLASYRNASGGVTVTLTDLVSGHTGGSSSGADGTDALIDIEGIAGSEFADTLTGNALANVLIGDGGDDTLNGGAGLDMADYRFAAGPVTVTLTNLFNGHTGGSSSGGDGADTLVDIENIAGSRFADSLTGNNAANVLIGRAGADAINGGAGVDTASYRFATGAVQATLTDLVSGHTGGSSSGADGVDSLVDIENLTGSNFADTLTGNAGANVLNGGLGNDVLDGGAGVDTASYDSVGAVTVSLAITGAQATGGGGTDTLRNIENLTGSNSADTLTGNAGVNVLIGALGADTLTGGAGNDVFRYLRPTDSTSAARDAITDFQLGDKIDLSIIDANTRPAFAGDNAFSATFVTTFTGAGGELMFTVSGTNGVLSGDVNGDRVADFAITLNNVTTLTSASIIL